MNNDALTKYLDLKQQLAAIEAQIDILKPNVMDEVRALNSRTQYGGYDFILSTITTWSFSPQVIQMQSALTDAKRNEKTTGVAKIKNKREILIVREHRDNPRALSSPVRDERLKQVREIHPRAYEKWTPEEEEVLRSEFQHGQSLKEISLHLKRQIGGIRSRLIKQGLLEK